MHLEIKILEAYSAVMDHKKLSGVSKARQGPISCAFMHVATIYSGVYNCSEYSHSCMFNR